MTLIGAVVALGLLVTGHKPKRFHYFIHFEVGKYWGGLNAGAFIFTDTSPTRRIKSHECGHGLQNIMLGVFMPFVVGLPSAVRYWYREYKINKGQGAQLPSYDSIWFEGWATRLGEKYFN